MTKHRFIPNAVALHRTFALTIEAMMGDLMFLFILCGGIWLAITTSKSASQRRQALRQAALARWRHAVQTCASYEQFRLAQVARITQRYPGRGTKAWLTWYGSHQQRDAWFEGEFPPRGAWLVLSGSDGYGPHTSNPHIFYVHKVHDLIML